MYIFKNALKNLVRNKGRNLLMGIILLTIIVATAVSILINTTSAAIIKDYKGRFGSEVFLNIDYDKAIKDGKFTEYQGAQGIEEIAPEKYLEFSKSEYLQKTALRSSTMIGFEGLRALDDEDWDSDLRGLLVGSNSVNITPDFENGARKMLEGEVYQNKNECIISRQFAELNKLAVGDSIKILRSGKPFTLKVTGIYEDNTMLDGGNASQFMQKNPNLNRHNEILTAAETAQEIGGIGYVDAVYYLKDPSMLEAFREELYQKGLPDYYLVKTDEASYNAVVGPVENMAKVTTTFMIIVLAVGGVILLLISTMAIRERKYEIGVLRAMGMKKAKVAIGFVSEMLLITAACLVIGFSVSSVVSQPVADSLLENQIKIAEQTKNSGFTAITQSTDPFAGQKNNTPLSELDVTLGWDAALQITMIALLLAVISSIIGIIFITRYEPMRILSERN
jgi:putative ABC transport system permease protein